MSQHNHGQRKDALPCYDCTSSDALSIYKNDRYWLAKCFSCGTSTLESKFKNKGYLEYLSDKEQQEMTTQKETTIKVSPEAQQTIEQSTEGGSKYVDWGLPVEVRGLEPETLKAYGTTVAMMTEDQFSHVFNTKRYSYASNNNSYFCFDYFSKHNPKKVVAQKVRSVKPNPLDDERPATINGDLKSAGMFGANLCDGRNMKYITIAEGEASAMSAYQMLGSEYPVLGLKAGADSVANCLRENFKWLNTFDGIRVVFDPDDPGRKAVEKASRVFDFEKFQVVKLDPEIGDPNDYLQAGLQDKFRRAFHAAQPYKPDDVIVDKELHDRLKDRKTPECFNYPFDKLNDVTYGMRKGEMDTWIAESGIGKSAFMKEIAYNLYKQTNEDVRIGLMFLEETVEKTALDLMSLEMKTRLHLPDVVYTDEEWERAYDKVLNSGRFTFIDCWGSADIDYILARVELLVQQFGCNFIFLDHVSMITADQRYSDERQALDRIVNKLASYVTDHDIHLTQVAHVNRKGSIRGTAGIEQVSHKVVRLERDKDHKIADFRDVTRLSVEKNRFNGNSGPAGFIEFCQETGRLKERLDITDEEFYNNSNNNSNWS